MYRQFYCRQQQQKQKSKRQQYNPQTQIKSFAMQFDWTRAAHTISTQNKQVFFWKLKKKFQNKYSVSLLLRDFACASSLVLNCYQNYRLRKLPLLCQPPLLRHGYLKIYHGSTVINLRNIFFLYQFLEFFKSQGLNRLERKSSVRAFQQANKK